MRLGVWQKTAVFATVAVVGLSGLLWFVLHDVVADELGDTTHLLLSLHGVSAYALLVAVGSLLPLHVRAGWRSGRNTITGVVTTAAMAVLSVTALMLYYGGEETQAAVKWIHLAFGFALLAVFPAHAFSRMTRVIPDDEALRAKDGLATGREAAAQRRQDATRSAGGLSLDNHRIKEAQ